MAGNDAQVQFQQNGGTRKWRYQGVSFDGQRKEKGVVEAQTRDQAIERIKKLGLYPTDLTDTAAGTGLNTEINIKAFEKYPSKKDFAVTARQLATMVAAGVSLIRALNIVTEQIENVKLRKAVQACVAQVEGGSSFSEAMSADPDSPDRPQGHHKAHRLPQRKHSPERYGYEVSASLSGRNLWAYQ